jgi:hypothetical protein
MRYPSSAPTTLPNETAAHALGAWGSIGPVTAPDRRAGRSGELIVGRSNQKRPFPTIAALLGSALAESDRLVATAAAGGARRSAPLFGRNTISVP